MFRSWDLWCSESRCAFAALAVEGCGGLFLFFLFEVPCDGLAEAFAELGLGLVAEFGAGAGDVGEGVLDVAFADGAVVGFGIEAELLGDGGVDIVERLALPGTDVEDAAGGNFAGGRAGEQVGADSVVDEVEVAAGETVAEDGGSLASHHFEGELGDDAGVRRVGGLAGAKDVEVAQTDALETIGAVEGLNVVLTRELLDGVGGERAREHVLLFGLGGLVSVGG